jgi:hypothetical protein
MTETGDRRHWATLTDRQRAIAEDLLATAMRLWSDPDAGLSIAEALEVAAIAHDRAVLRSRSLAPTPEPP